MQDHKDIHEAINAIMGEVGYVQKSRSQGLSYSYAGEAALIQAIRPSMVEHGVYMHVHEIIKIVRESYSTAKGTAMINTSVHGVVRFTHVGGSYVDVQAFGEGADSGDKSGNKAMTGMYKYALRQTFNIETGDDPDKEPSEKYERPSKKPATKEALPTADALPVDEQFPKGDMANEAEKLADGFSKSDLLKADNITSTVSRIKDMGKEATAKDVAVFIATHIEKGHKYQIEDVAKQFVEKTGEQNATE